MSYLLLFLMVPFFAQAAPSDDSKSSACEQFLHKATSSSDSTAVVVNDLVRLLQFRDEGARAVYASLKPQELGIFVRLIYGDEPLVPGLIRRFVDTRQDVAIDLFIKSLITNHRSWDVVESPDLFQVNIRLNSVQKLGLTLQEYEHVATFKYIHSLFETLQSRSDVQRQLASALAQEADHQSAFHSMLGKLLRFSEAHEAFQEYEQARLQGTDETVSLSSTWPKSWLAGAAAAFVSAGVLYSQPITTAAKLYTVTPCVITGAGCLAIAVLRRNQQSPQRIVDRYADSIDTMRNP